MAQKIALDKELLRTWMKVRSAWTVGAEQFSYTLSFLSEKQMLQLYDVVKYSLYKDSYVQMLREHPELRQIVKSDDDRFCMHDIYENISWRLGKKEPAPKDNLLRSRMRGKIGRESPSYDMNP